MKEEHRTKQVHDTMTYTTKQNEKRQKYKENDVIEIGQNRCRDEKAQKQPKTPK